MTDFWRESTMSVPLYIVLLVSIPLVLGERLRVCYYTNWSQYRNGDGKFWPETIDPFLCTHIMYAFGKLVNNKITNYEWNDPDTDWSDGLYTRVNKLKENNPKLKVLLAMGGWTAGSVDYSNMAATAATRRTFIDSALSFLRTHNFDGLDMDWEYPAKRGGAASDFTTFGLLTKELRMAFDNEASTTGNERLLLTAAVAAGKATIDGSYDVPVMVQYMDFICIMTYDFNGAWSTKTGHNSPLKDYAGSVDPTFNIEFAANYWHNLGAPKDRLIIGLPTYGRTFKLTNPSNFAVGAPASGAGPAGKYTREGGFLAYYEICEKQQSGAGTTYRDTQAGVPYYVEGDLWVTFDDETSIYDKTNYIIAEGYGGAMVWALALDDFMFRCGNKKNPLMSLMKDLLVAADNGGTMPTMPTTAQPVATTTKPTTAQPVTTAQPGVTTAQPGATTTKPVATTANPIVTTAQPGETGFCASKPDGLYGDPADCASFYHCANGMGDSQRCPPGTLWQNSIEICDYAWNVKCDVGVTTIAPSTTARTSRTTTVMQVVDCSVLTNGYFSYPGDCNRYIQCVNGARFNFICPAGLHFNPAFNYCDWPRNVGCQK